MKFYNLIDWFVVDAATTRSETNLISSCLPFTGLRRLIAIEDSILDAIFVKVIPLWLSEDDFDPLLYTGAISDCD